MPEVDAFETAYGRLAFARLAGEGPEGSAASGGVAARDGVEPAAVPRSRLLPRLALMAPSRKPRRRGPHPA